ncbi:MAG: hypothetical protein QM820_06450 [Minicystis sp.]
MAGTGNYDDPARSEILYWNDMTGEIKLARKDGGNWILVNATSLDSLDWKPAGNGDYNHDGKTDLYLWNPKARATLICWYPGASEAGWKLSCGSGPSPEPGWVYP